MDDPDASSVQVAPDGLVIYRASALGGCTKQLIALRQGYEEAPVPAQMQKVFDAGHDWEEVVHARMPLVARQTRIELAVSSKIAVVGHVDGVSDTVDEVKSQNQDEWDKFERDGWDMNPLWAKYKWQASAYMIALERPLRLIRVLRDSDPANPRISTQVYFEPWYSLAEIRARVLTIESQAAVGVLPVACDPSVQYPCPVYYLHEYAEFEYGDETVDVLARQYNNAKTVEKIAKQKADESKRALRVKGVKMRTSTGTKVTFFEGHRLNDPIRREPDEFWLETTWENVRVTLPKASTHEGSQDSRDD